MSVGVCLKLSLLLTVLVLIHVSLKFLIAVHLSSSQFKTEGIEEVTPAPTLSSGDFYNLTLMSGWTVYQSLSYINGTLQIVGQKTMDFWDKSLDAQTVIMDINLFLTDMDGTYDFMDSVVHEEELTSVDRQLQIFKKDIDTLKGTVGELISEGEPFLSGGT